MIDPITGPFDYKLDPPAEPQSFTCDVCLGSGKFGCTRFCDQTEGDKDICRKYHSCEFCKGYGRLEMSVQDFKDDKANDDTQKEMERGL